MYWPLKLQKLSRDSKINRFIEMLYSDPEFVSEEWQQKVNTATNLAIHDRNRRSYENMVAAWRSPVFGGPIFQPIQTKKLWDLHFHGKESMIDMNDSKEFLSFENSVF